MKYSPSTPRQKLIVVVHEQLAESSLTEISMKGKETDIQWDKHASSSNRTLVLAQYQAQNKHLRKEENTELSFC